MLLKEKVALITGSSRGIGRAIALALAQEGADVTVNYLHSKQLAHKTADAIRSMNRNALALQADVSDYNQVKELINRTLNEFQRIDILVNCAGVNKDILLGKMTPKIWDEVLAVNLTGTFNCTKGVIEHMKKRENGSVISISSVVGQVGVIGASNYAAAKAGIFGFTKAVAKEVALKGITVNALALGYFNIGMLRRLPQNIRESILRQIPMGRFGRVEEVTQVVLFLASDASSYITGQVIHVNGGFYM